jgi:hypothetical protein
MSFGYLRGGVGERLRVESEPAWVPEDPGVLVREWAIQAPERFRASLYASDGIYRLWAADSGWFEIDPQRSMIRASDCGNSVKREERLLGIPALLCFVARGDAPLHAAAVDAGRGAILLAAPGRHGKTTLAAGFVRAGSRLLSEDLCCLRIRDQPLVVPGPAMLRLRSDVAEALNIRCAQTLEAGDARLHLALDPRTRGDCTPVEIRTIVFLRGHASQFECHRSDPRNAVRDLFALGFRLPGEADTARAFSVAADLVASVPAWDVSYPLRIEQLEQIVDAVTHL